VLFVQHFDVFIGIFMIKGERGSQKVRIFNGMTHSYLMIEKHSSNSYSVLVAQRNGVSNYMQIEFTYSQSI